MQIWSQLNNEEQAALLARPALAQGTELKTAVENILKAVQQSGDAALLELTERFDKVALDALRLPIADIDNAEAELSQSVKDAIGRAYANICTFHEAQKPNDVRIETMPGVLCELKHKALDTLGLYIPGGSAPLPSTVLMLGIPAQVAGCRRPILCTPPGKDGQIAAEIRYAAKLCGIKEIYLVGGAQAIAAMALGTQSIPKVDKIFGPGNSFVTQAKQLVSQLPGGPAIDMPAGPSEVLVIADSLANPVFVAADLLSQAEHGADSQTVLVTDSAALIEAVKAQVEIQLTSLSRKAIAAKAMANSRFILVKDMDEAVQVSNAYGPEHLIVQTAFPESLLETLDNAGSIFVGPWSPESAGDYASGTNHVLPTYGYARNTSSLGLLDFMRRYTLQTISEDGLKALGPAIMRLAEAEGLDAHRQAVAVRLEQQDVC
ncbi:histidinol dehydrogenase [Aliiglaciecola sp. CAU 1673]|uniref:histidinol dehydrogenase n=1 Tax=Aliiglaciecola sp. CAU 1673 TaxID=3032595 RepID=UPI0023DB9E70|nr:histidinol dehydrogenase [Aliiglaciecola sp. CAU 1673]MDF2179537.1 histidinol dehydrogenase [Aliiglaciecola sp. CAU 1673]